MTKYLAILLLFFAVQAEAAWPTYEFIGANQCTYGGLDGPRQGDWCAKPGSHNYHAIAKRWAQHWRGCLPPDDASCAAEPGDYFQVHLSVVNAVPGSYGTRDYYIYVGYGTEDTLTWTVSSDEYCPAMGDHFKKAEGGPGGGH